MDSFNSWWDALGTTEKIYWGFALAFSLWMVLLVIFSFAAADTDVQVDHDADGSHHDQHTGSMQIFTIKNFVAFFAVMGWIGIACIHSGLAQVPTIAISALSGAVAMLIMAWLFFQVSKLTDSGTLELKNAVGAIGEVYLPIPAGKKGRGKVMVNVQGSMRELDAMTESNQEIKTGSTVKVTAILENEILIVSGIA